MTPFFDSHRSCISKTSTLLRRRSPGVSVNIFLILTLIKLCPCLPCNNEGRSWFRKYEYITEDVFISSMPLCCGHTYVYVCVCVSFKRVNAYVCLCLPTCVRGCVRTCVYACACVYTCVHACVRI